MENQVKQTKVHVTHREMLAIQHRHGWNLKEMLSYWDNYQYSFDKTSDQQYRIEMLDWLKENYK